MKGPAGPRQTKPPNDGGIIGHVYGPVLRPEGLPCTCPWWFVIRYQEIPCTPIVHAETAEPFRVSPPEAVAYLVELLCAHAPLVLYRAGAHADGSPVRSRRGGSRSGEWRASS